MLPEVQIWKQLTFSQTGKATRSAPNGYIAMSIAVLRLSSFSLRYRNHMRNGTSSRSGGSRTFSALAKIKKVAAKSSSIFCFSSSCHYDRHDENGRAHSRQSSMRPLLDLYEGTVGVRSPVGGVQFHCGRHWAADAMFTVGGRGLIDFFLSGQCKSTDGAQCKGGVFFFSKRWWTKAKGGTPGGPHPTTEQRFTCSPLQYAATRGWLARLVSRTTILWSRLVVVYTGVFPAVDAAIQAIFGVHEEHLDGFLSPFLDHSGSGIDRVRSYRAFFHDLHRN